MNPPTENIGPKSFYTQEHVGSVWLSYAYLIPSIWKTLHVARCSSIVFRTRARALAMRREQDESYQDWWRFFERQREHPGYSRLGCQTGAGAYHRNLCSERN